MEKSYKSIAKRIKLISPILRLSSKDMGKKKKSADEQTSLQVFEVIVNSSLREVFNLGVGLENLVFRPRDVNGFTNDHPDWIRTVDHEIYFLCEKNTSPGNYFVTCLYRDSDDEVCSRFFQLSDRRILLTENRPRIAIRFNDATWLAATQLGL